MEPLVLLLVSVPPLLTLLVLAARHERSAQRQRHRQLRRIGEDLGLTYRPPSTTMRLGHRPPGYRGRWRGRPVLVALEQVHEVIRLGVRMGGLPAPAEILGSRANTPALGQARRATGAPRFDEAFVLDGEPGAWSEATPRARQCLRRLASWGPLSLKEGTGCVHLDVLASAGDVRAVLDGWAIVADALEGGPGDRLDALLANATTDPVASARRRAGQLAMQEAPADPRVVALAERWLASPDADLRRTAAGFLGVVDPGPPGAGGLSLAEPDGGLSLAPVGQLSCA